jgi:hypothetical protein
MYQKMKYDSKNINQANNSIFKQLNTNIIFDYQKNNIITELIQNQDIYSNYKTNINNNKNLRIYLNGTTEPDENINFMKTQRTKFTELTNKSNYNTNLNTAKNKPVLNRYNSYKRIATTNINNNNNLFNLPGNNKVNKNKKINGGSKNKIINHNNSKNHNNTQIHNQRVPATNNKKSVIPLGNNKYKTIGDNNYYSNITNRIHNDMNINNNFNNKNNYNEIQNHNTIDINNLLSNHNNNINKKYNMKKYNTSNNINSNLNKNKQTKKINYNYNHNYYKNIEIKRNGSNVRPKTPDNNKRRKSYSRFTNNNINNQRIKTPDRQRSKMKLNLNKDYLNTIDNNKINKNGQHYNYMIRDYNHTIDNNSNNGKYKYSARRLNTNDYFKLHKKTINNYDNRQNMTITGNNTITNNNSSSRKNIIGSLYNNGNQTRPQKRLSKNSSQGNILGHNNYNINLNSNGINHIHTNINENYNYKNYHSNNNTNLITPIKYINQRSNFKGDNIQLTQIRPPNNYNLYDETFQSFGTNLTTLTNNQDLISKRNIITNINENNNYFEMKTRQENIKEISKNNDYEFNSNKNNFDYNFDKYKELFLQNRNNETEKLQSKLRERNGNNNNSYIPATINNTGNKTYSYFNNIKNNNKIKEKENIKNDQSNNLNDIDFNDLDQFSPPYSKAQLNLNKNIDSNSKNENKYMNLGCIEERNRNYETVTYDYNFGSNRKVIDDFINQLKTNN